MEQIEIEKLIKVNRIDVYKSTGLADRMGITDFPSVALIENKKVIKIIDGLPEKSELISVL